MTAVLKSEDGDLVATLFEAPKGQTLIWHDGQLFKRYGGRAQIGFYRHQPDVTEKPARAWEAFPGERYR